MVNLKVTRRSDAERKDGKAPLYVVFTISGEKVKLPLDIHVTVAEWNPIRQAIKGSSKEVKDKNLIITNTLARINDILVTCRLSGETLTKSLFLAKYRKPATASIASFASYAIARMERLRHSIEFGTYRHHRAAIQKLQDFAPALTFADITHDWIRGYAAHLTKDHGNSPNTVAKNLGIIRAYLAAAVRDGFLKRNPFEMFRMPSAEPQVTFLTEEELAKVCEAYKKKEMPVPEHQALAIWLWMAFTGMHISDMRALRIEQIFDGEIHYTRIKTKVKVVVPLSSPAKALYKDIAGERRQGYFCKDMPTDQWFNRRIKSAMKIIEIGKNVSAKAGRHTFATIFYEKTKDIGTLSRLLGHTSVRHTMVYTHILRRSRFEGMNAFDSFRF